MQKELNEIIQQLKELKIQIESQQELENGDIQRIEVLERNIELLKTGE